jgi:alkylation response protein AidB-like acyl-CoA dehydrogenase
LPVDIRETPREREVRERYAAWLAGFLPADYYDRYPQYRFDRELRTAYQRAAFDSGWLMPDWPEGLGGHALGPVESLGVRLEAGRRAAPKLNCIQAVGVVAPSLREFGTQEQKDELLVKTLRGDWWWALGMSEPNAGSDLAGLRTRAVLEGDHYVVSGQKIWTTQAHESRWCLLFARTDSVAPKHKGISCLLMDLESPGLAIRPIGMATGTDEVFCEVFLDDVRVPRANLLGAPGDGWKVAVRSLAYERDMIWVMNSVEIRRGLRKAAGALAGNSDPSLEVEIGRRLSDAEAIRYTGYRTLTNDLEGRPSPEFAIQKLLGSESLQRTWELAASASGPAGLTDGGLVFDQLDALAATLYGGTSEIQRNIIAERVLGLPR